MENPSNASDAEQLKNIRAALDELDPFITYMDSLVETNNELPTLWEKIRSSDDLDVLRFLVPELITELYLDDDALDHDDTVDEHKLDAGFIGLEKLATALEYSLEMPNTVADVMRIADGTHSQLQNVLKGRDGGSAGVLADGKFSPIAPAIIDTRSRTLYQKATVDKMKRLDR